jgi:alpha-D-xyloside xylohydrolase
MAESLRGGLSLSLSGFGFWSHDIGGFEGMPPVEVYKRWIAFGLLSSHSRLHGSSSYRVPWQYDEEAVDVLRFFTKLKCRLMPYLFAKAVEAHQTGVPTMRAMLMEFPNDPASDTLDRQYLLGDSLLVAPVFAADGSVSYYVPEGRWTNLITGAVVTGPRWVREEHGFLSLPLLVRPNTVLPLGSHEEKPDYDFAEGVTFQIHELEEGHEASASVPNLRGEEAISLLAKRQGGQVHIEARGDSQTWNVLLAGIEQVGAVEGGVAEASERGLLVRPNSGSSSLTITL